MKTKDIILVLVVAAVLVAPARAMAETQLFVLPVVGLVAGLMGGSIIGKSVGIAAFGTAIPAKVPFAVLGGALGASLLPHVVPLIGTATPAVLSLAQGILIAAVTGVGTAAASFVARFGIEEAATRALALVRRFGAAVAEAACALFRCIRRVRVEPTGPESPTTETDPPELTTVVEYRWLLNPGALVPDLTPMPETWKGQPVW